MRGREREITHQNKDTHLKVVWCGHTVRPCSANNNYQFLHTGGTGEQEEQEGQEEQEEHDAINN